MRNENSTGECRAAMDELAGLCLTEFPGLIAKCSMSGSLVYEVTVFIPDPAVQIFWGLLLTGLSKFFFLSSCSDLKTLEEKGRKIISNLLVWGNFIYSTHISFQPKNPSPLDYSLSLNILTKLCPFIPYDLCMRFSFTCKTPKAFYSEA